MGRGGGPYVITSTALGSTACPGQRRVTVGKIGCGGQGSGLARGRRPGGGRLRLLEGPPRALGRASKLHGLRRLPRAAGPRRHRRRGHRHARPLARARRRWPPPRPARTCTCEKPLGAEHRAGPGLPRGGQALRPHLPVRHAAALAAPTAASAANWSATARIGKVKAIEVVAPDGEPGRLDQAAAGARRASTTTCGSARRRWRPYCGQAARRRRLVARSTTTPSASSPAGAPIRWTSWSGATTRTWPARGRSRARASSPTEGRNNVVMRLGREHPLRQRREDDLQARRRPHAVHRHEGWVGISRGGIDAEPKSLLEVKLGPTTCTCIESRDHGRTSSTRSSRAARRSATSTTPSTPTSSATSRRIARGESKRKIVLWDPVKEEIVGDADASQADSPREILGNWSSRKVHVTVANLLHNRSKR